MRLNLTLAALSLHLTLTACATFSAPDPVIVTETLAIGPKPDNRELPERPNPQEGMDARAELAMCYAWGAELEQLAFDRGQTILEAFDEAQRINSEN